jgi:hypothetical protein
VLSRDDHPNRERTPRFCLSHRNDIISSFYPRCGAIAERELRVILLENVVELGHIMTYRFLHVLLAFSALALLPIPCCGEKDDVTAIRSLIKKGAGHAEKHEIEGILKLASEDLRVLPGDADRREVRRILWLAFRHYGDLRVIYPRPGIEIEKDGNHASAQFPFLIVKRDQSFPKLNELVNDSQKWVQEVGERADLYRLKLRLSKIRGEWLVNHAQIERFSGLGFND